MTTEEHMIFAEASLACWQHALPFKVRESLYGAYWFIHDTPRRREWAFSL